jgi:GH15 family glucan-1,4-alpha-glucosidase
VRRVIEDYALLSDLQTAALVHRRGSIDWCCFPRFDSDASFAALLGHREHGRWLLAPETPSDSTRRYRNESLALETEWETHEGTIRVVDLMPPREDAPKIVRIVEGLAGRVTVRSEIVIRFGHGRIVPSLRRLDHAHVATAGPDAIVVRTPIASTAEDTAIVSTFEVRVGERGEKFLFKVLAKRKLKPLLPPPLPRTALRQAARGLMFPLGLCVVSKDKIPRPTRGPNLD